MIDVFRSSKREHINPTSKIKCQVLLYIQYICVTNHHGYMQHARFLVYDYIIILTYHNMHVYPELEEWGAFLSAKELGL